MVLLSKWISDEAVCVQSHSQARSIRFRGNRLHRSWYENLIKEISLQREEPRRIWINPRVIKRPQSKLPKKRKAHRSPPHLAHTFDETIRVLTLRYRVKSAKPEQVSVPSTKKQQSVDALALASTINAKAGDVIFKAENKNSSTPCFEEAFMCFGACDGYFYYLDKVTGELKWMVGELKRVDASPVLHQGLVLFASFANQGNWLQAVHADTGNEAWKREVAGVGNSCPLLREGKLLIAGQKEWLCLVPRDGSIVASYDNTCVFLGSIKGPA
jgi:hypothetical protein